MMLSFSVDHTPTAMPIVISYLYAWLLFSVLFMAGSMLFAFQIVLRIIYGAFKEHPNGKRDKQKARIQSEWRKIRFLYSYIVPSCFHSFFLSFYVA